VSYTVQAKPDAATGAEIAARARVIYDGLPPQDSEPIVQCLDNRAPTTTTLSVTSLPADASGNPAYSVQWTAIDDDSGIKGVTLYVAEDGGDFRIWRREATTGSSVTGLPPTSQALFTGRTGHSYEFLAAATDLAGNREAANIINAVNYRLVATDSGLELTPLSVQWDAERKAAILTIPFLAPGGWDLRILNPLRSRAGIRLAANYQSHFTTVVDMSSEVRIAFSNTRGNRLTGERVRLPSA
jgi:hypothetical protein